MKNHNINFIQILFLSLSLILFAGCQQSEEPFDHSFLTFEEVFQNSVEPELPSFASSSTPPAFKRGSFSSPEEGVIRGGFYILYPGDALDKTLPEDAAVKGVYLITYENIEGGVRLKNVSLSIEDSDAEIRDLRLQFPGKEMEMVPLVLGEEQDIVLDRELLGKSYQTDSFPSGLWLRGTFVYEGKEYEIMGIDL